MNWLCAEVWNGKLRVPLPSLPPYAIRSDIGKSMVPGCPLRKIAGQFKKRKKERKTEVRGPSGWRAAGRALHTLESNGRCAVAGGDDIPPRGIHIIRHPIQLDDIKRVTAAEV